MPCVQFDRPQRPSAASPSTPLEPSDALRTFVFMANLAAQEATGDPAASTSVERVLNRMKGSTESDTVLLGLVAEAPAVAELSPVGLALVPSSASAHEPDLNYLGFIHVGFNLREDKHIAECELVLDVDYLPLPGEPLSPAGTAAVTELYDAAEWLARNQGRTCLQTGLLHAAGTNIDADPTGRILSERGYRQVLSETQLWHPVPDDLPQPPSVMGLKATVATDYAIPDSLVDGVLELLEVASADAPREGLSVEPLSWDRTRLHEAAARQRDRNAHTILVILHETATQRPVALAELSRHAGSDPSVAEWSLTVTARDRRRQGLARIAKLHALQALPHLWPKVERIYTNRVTSDEAMCRLYAHFHPIELSTSTVWEKAL